MGMRREFFSQLERANIKVYCHKVLVCDSSGEYLEFDIQNMYVDYSYPEL